jgi:hypothetical protein
MQSNFAFGESKWITKKTESEQTVTEENNTWITKKTESEEPTVANVFDDYAGYCQRADGTVYATFYKNNCFSNKDISFKEYAKIIEEKFEKFEKKK